MGFPFVSTSSRHIFCVHCGLLCGSCIRQSHGIVSHWEGGNNVHGCERSLPQLCMESSICCPGIKSFMAICSLNVIKIQANDLRRKKRKKEKKKS